MDLNLENGWQVLPIGGDTGTAYMGIKQQEKVFLKRNPSPFIAALSLEEITPKLIWSKRMQTGDTLTAQQWMNGRCLERSEMHSTRVLDLLSRVHHSDLLKRMLEKVGGVHYHPEDFLTLYFRGVPAELLAHPLLKKCAAYLETHLPQYEESQYEVSHGDLNRKNFLLSDSGDLYLVDWESVMFADPAKDLSMLMCRYVPRADWKQWLESYFGKELPEAMEFRIQWYALMNLLLDVKYHYRRGRFHEMNQDILKIQAIFTNIYA
ncbi:aminoglycoside phosphotransferase [Ligilactobacillus salitolerans]|uniref:Aminoglycoside phosphotransferase n=1 Tax=Ligilactobacillus salitolerans TaxID=1808352 RepID=A0A401ISG9_9LACO|nr:phosphotransferase family protein [Ligilactobacillus salitolerans]GBG94478.1 aminoglycoside phosphotransferase [Ligilactobacillus salitolerans]